MKISAYHKRRGDYVRFVKGLDAEARTSRWDRIYVSTLFTFNWGVTIKTINFYLDLVRDPADLWVGGVMGTLMAAEIRQLTGATVIEGLLDRPGQLDSNSKVIVDALPPDYSMLDMVDYEYGLQDAYLGYATRGCPNKCGFCAVRTIEPEFIGYLPLKRQIRSLEMLYGERPNLVLMDNNILASDSFEQIIDDLVELGFERGARLGRRLRHVDFNQGTDARLLTEERMKQLARVAVRPLRLAFDDSKLTPIYEKGVRLAAKYGVGQLSNYVLYNYKDTPEDFYDRLRLNVLLNQELGTHIYSFPMKYMPLDAKDRSHVGTNWSPRLLRGVQCILLATRGKVGTHRDFFEAAFGVDGAEFRQIALMPDDYIIHRRLHETNSAADWLRDYRKLTKSESAEFLEVVSKNRVAESEVTSASTARLKRILSHYVRRREDGIVSTS
ncbi:MAG: cobalamin-binding domain-containing protein [Actinomycetia bacterium]|nr:cobalamin-binding domain-containing protein [Actinomycetes bacterium]